MNNSAFSGDDFQVVDSDEKAKEINEYRVGHTKSKQTPLIIANKDSVFNDSSKPKELPIIIKSDVHGSSEALKNAIEKIKHPEAVPKIILSNIGVITETTDSQTLLESSLPPMPTSTTPMSIFACAKALYIMAVVASKNVEPSRSMSFRY